MTNIQLFYENIFYLHLGAILHKDIEFAEIKKAVLEIVNNLLRSENIKIIETMGDSAFSILR